MNDKINNLKDQIQDLISKATEKNNQQKTKLNFLFTKLNEVKELETLERLKGYENGKYLKAYLFYQSIKRANYQVEHLELTKLDNIDKCLEMIEKDLEANQPKEKAPKELTNEQLLIMLGEKIAGKEIIKTYTRGLPCLGIWKNGGRIIKVCLDTGKIEPDPAEEFLKKHGINDKK